MSLGFEDGFVSEMVDEVDDEGAVILEFGGSGALRLVDLVEASTGEVDRIIVVGDVETDLHGVEADLAMSLAADNQRGRSAEVEES